MLITLCKSKIQRAVITDKSLHYEGSITIDRALMNAAKILPYERVQVLNLNNGERLETYVLVGEENSGTICLNGPAARRGELGDLLTIISYGAFEEGEIDDWEPVVIYLDENNRIRQVKAR